MTPSPQPHKGYRQNVGIVLTDGNGQVWVGERADTPGSWQMPQGGVDEGEDLLSAARRELFEEVGTPPDELELLAIHPQWLGYTLPEMVQKKSGVSFKGQTQKWFLFEYQLGDEINLDRAQDDEFADWKWVTPEWILEHIVEFRRPVYEQVFKEFNKYF